jgi:hypothetical protein
MNVEQKLEDMLTAALHSGRHFAQADFIGADRIWSARVKPARAEIIAEFERLQAIEDDVLNRQDELLQS